MPQASLNEPVDTTYVSELRASFRAPRDALSVDVEDYYQVEAFADRVPRSEWNRFPSRVARNTERVLELLAKHRARATFFVLGWIAEREPALVRAIAAAGHEIACHGHAHERVTAMTPARFRDDLRRARQAIAEAAGVRVVGYRAPTFSIQSKNLWALEVLADEGFVYDSSIFPVRHDLYGFPEFPRFPRRLPLRSGKTIFEIPLSTVRLLGMNFPCAGGGYLRLFPMAYTRWAMRRIHRKDGGPVVVYFHPWELDPDQPKLNGKWKSRLRHYRGLEGFAGRIEELLAGGRFQPLIALVRPLVAWEPGLPKVVSAGEGAEAPAG
jgi:polysaccharide deacetylase family protein (PEP-CTERM system associated)